MGDTEQKPSLSSSLATPKGAMIAVPVIFGAALILSLFANRDQPSAGAPSGTAQQEAASPSLPSTPARALAAANSASKASGSGEKNYRVAETTKVATSSKAGSFTPAQRQEIGQVVRDYLLANPEILVEVGEELEKRRQEKQNAANLKVLIAKKDKVFRSPYDYVLGNKDGDVTIVEYFDYNCGWCKRALNEVVNLTKNDKKVRVVMKEFPIFGEDSQFAAKAAMASVKLGKYWPFHVAMMRAERVTKANTMQIAASVGIDVEALKKEMAKPEYDKALQENARLAQQLGMQGTPAFIIDANINYGYVPLDGLKKTLAEIRKNGCKIC